MNDLYRSAYAVFYYQLKKIIGPNDYLKLHQILLLTLINLINEEDELNVDWVQNLQQISKDILY